MLVSQAATLRVSPPFKIIYVVCQGKNISICCIKLCVYRWFFNCGSGAGLCQGDQPVWGKGGVRHNLKRFDVEFFFKNFYILIVQPSHFGDTLRMNL